MAIWPTQPLHNAKDVDLGRNPGTLPNMADTIANWFQLIVMEKVIKTVTATFTVHETTTPVQFQGVVETLPTRRLVMTSQGQRRWQTKRVFCWPGVPLTPDDVVLYLGTQYRVGDQEDFSQYGYIAYGLLEDYTGSGPDTP